MTATLIRCVAPGCFQYLEDDDPSDLGVCSRCGMKIARRFADSLRYEQNMRNQESRIARMVARADALSRDTVPNMYAAYEQPPGSTWVYYVRIHDYIKIGYSKNVRSRIHTLRTSIDNVLAVEPGGRSKEERRHEKFHHLRIGRWENFRPEPELLAHIDEIVATYGRPKWLDAPRRGKNGPVEVRRVTD